MNAITSRAKTSTRGPVRRWVPTRLGRGPLLAFSASTFFAFLVGWNADIEDPGTGADASWQVALYMATRDGMHFGKDIVVQYGPLGFLKFPVSYDVELASLSFVYVVTVELLTAGVLVWAAHRWSRSWVAAAGMAAIATSLLADPRIWELAGSAPVVVLAVVACAHAIRGDAPPCLNTALVYGGGLLVGIEVLGKVNLGVLVGVMVVFTLAVGPGRRGDLARFALTFLVTVTSMWFLTGQSITNIDDYLRTSAQIVSGWPLLGSNSIPADRELLALVAAVVAMAAGWLTTRGLATHRRLSLVVLVVLFLIGTFKSSFTVGGAHLFIFFSSVVALWFAFRWGPDRKLPLAAFGALLAVYVAAAVLVPASEENSTKARAVGINPLNNRPTSLLDTVGPDAGRASLRDEYRVGSRALRLIGNRPVHIFPEEAGVAWAYRLNWAPLPVLEPSLVTTPVLDRINSTSLESAGGPTRILRESSPDIGLSTPASAAAMLCRFRQVDADSNWQVLARGSNRCGPGRVVRRVSVRAGETVPVPQIPGALVRASIRGLEPGFVEVTATGFLPTLKRTITVDGRSSPLKGTMASEGVVLTAPPGLDFPGSAFRVTPQARTISLDAAERPLSRHGRITVEFRAYDVSRLAFRD